MTARDSSRADRDFEQAVDRLLGGEPHGAPHALEGDLTTAAVVARALAPERIPVDGARGRVWQRLALSLDQEPTFGWRERLGLALAERRRATATAAAMALVVSLGLLSPVGQMAVASAQEGLKFTLVRLTPSGPVPVPEVATRRIGNTIIMVDALVSVAEAERQAGFPIVQPRDLPREATLLGAHVPRHEADTPAEWRSVTLTYEVGDQVLTLTQARNGGRPQTTASNSATTTKANPLDVAASSPMPATTAPAAATPVPVPAAAIKLVPLQTEKASVRIGAADGTLTTTRLPSGDVLGQSLSWQVGDRSYEVNGLVGEAVLRRIAASLVVGAADR